MGARRSGVVVVVLAATACGPETDPPPGGGSLYLMNQTHEPRKLSRYRAKQLDCVGTARDPLAGLTSARFELERCITLAPAAIGGLDPDDEPDLPPACDAVALQCPGLAPHALFWTDTGYDYRRTRTEDEILVALVSVGDLLILEPASNAFIAPLDTLPDNPCEWAP